MKKHRQQNIIVNSDITPRIQETHIFIGHLLCDIIETNLDKIS